MDSGKSPALISEEHFAFGVNVSSRGGRPRTRPAFKQLSFSSPDAALTLASSRTFQGAFAFFDASSGATALIAVFGGRLVRFNLLTMSADVLTPAGWLDAYRVCWFVQADKFLVVQDGVNPPVIFDGVTARRSRTGLLNPNKTLSSLTQTGGTATATTSSPHGFSTNDYVQIEGASPVGFNTEAYITVTSPTTFTFPVTSTLSSPATVAGAYCRWAPEVPVGAVMAYGQGRLFVAGADRRTFKAGDIIYGDVRGTADNVLRFTEEIYLAEGGDFSFPSTMGRIVSMGFVPFQDTATGQGELLVMGEFGVSSYNVSAERTNWKSTQIQRVTFTEIGAVSPVGAVGVNNDVVFRTGLGIRSYRQARADLNSYGQTPISAEVNRILDLDDKSLLGRVSAVYFANRMLMTCGPQTIQVAAKISSLDRSGGTLTVTTETSHPLAPGDSVTVWNSQGFDATYTVLTVPSTVSLTVACSEYSPSEAGGNSFLTSPKLGDRVVYRGVVSLDFNSVSGVGGKTSAAYDGVWTGLSAFQIVPGFVTGAPRAFAFVSDGSLATTVWEITDSFGPDVLASGSEVSQECALETRVFDFKKPFLVKRLVGCSMWVSDLQGEGEVRLFYRPSNYPCWTLWGVKSFCAKVGDFLPESDSLSSSTPRGLPQMRELWNFPTPPEACDESSGGILSQSTGFQIRVEWTGRMTLDQLVLHAVEQPTNFMGGC